MYRSILTTFKFVFFSSFFVGDVSVVARKPVRVGPGILRVTANEGEQIGVVCPRNFVIAVVKSFYGVVGPDDKHPTCQDFSATIIMQARCNIKQSCNPVVDNTLFPQTNCNPATQPRQLCAVKWRCIWSRCNRFHCGINGQCVLNQNYRPSCICKGEWSGERCEVSRLAPFTTTTPAATTTPAITTTTPATTTTTLATTTTSPATTTTTPATTPTTPAATTTPATTPTTPVTTSTTPATTTTTPATTSTTPATTTTTPAIKTTTLARTTTTPSATTTTKPATTTTSNATPTTTPAATTTTLATTTTTPSAMTTTPTTATTTPAASKVPSPVGSCESNPCKNGGVCSVEDLKAKCTCKGDWMGSYCTVSPCVVNNCLNGGRCVVTNGKAECECLLGWFGKLCQENAQAASVRLGPVCHQTLDRGSCNHNKERFYFNSTTKKCEKFQYGGCGGNQNNFEMKKDCQNACHKGIGPVEKIT